MYSTIPTEKFGCAEFTLVFKLRNYIQAMLLGEEEEG